MSQIRSNNVVIGTALWVENDWRIQPASYRPLLASMPEEMRWPRSNFRSAGLTAAEAPLNSAPLVWDWEPYMQSAPLVGQRRFIVTGTTTDRSGAALASCTVRLYETASNNVMDTGVVSDASGVYVATSPSSTTCYAVAYKSGSPDVQGTTVNTLTPA